MARRRRRRDLYRAPGLLQHRHETRWQHLALGRRLGRRGEVWAREVVRRGERGVCWMVSTGGAWPAIGGRQYSIL